MANTEGIKMKFLVVKHEDIANHLDEEEQQQLFMLLDYINGGRSAAGKKRNTYVVVNTDEPYADEVIEIMKSHGHWG